MEFCEGSSFVFRRCLDTADRYAASHWPVLLEGETGSGKEMFARRVHDRSRRRLNAFVPVNCGALPPGLFESELFGYERGSFSGAAQGSRGLVRQAHGGTLLLDEIGDLDLSLQVKLLRFLDSGEVRPVGATRVETSDVRIIAATNVSLLEAVRAGRFRQDLYERLSVLRLVLPPLRARKEDVLPLAASWLRRLGGEGAPAVLKKLEDYQWPGNVRQLRNVLVRAVVRGDGCVSGPLLDELLAEERSVQGRGPAQEVFLSGSLDDIERRVICDRLRTFHGNRKRTAEALGIAKSTLHDKLRRWRTGDGNPAASFPAQAEDDDDDAISMALVPPRGGDPALVVCGAGS